MATPRRPKAVAFAMDVPNDTPGAGMQDARGVFDTPVAEEEGQEECEETLLLPEAEGELTTTTTTAAATTSMWRTKHPDDKRNSRLRHLQALARRHRDVKYWWVDFLCAPSTTEAELLDVADAVPHLVKCCGKMIALVDDSHPSPRAHLSAGADGWLDGGWCRLERLAASAPFDVRVEDDADMKTLASFNNNNNNPPYETISLETPVYVCRANDPLLRIEPVPSIREPGHCDPLDAFFWDDDVLVSRRNDAMRQSIERDLGVGLLEMEWEAAAEREDLVPQHEKTRERVKAARDLLFSQYNTSLRRGADDQRREELLDLVQLMGADEGHDDRQTLLELTEMLAKEIRAGWDLKLDNPFDWTYTRFGLTNEYRDEVRHVVADESGSCVVGLNLRACGPLDCHVLGPCLEKLLLLQHLDLSQNPDLTGDLAALNGLVYLSTLNVSDCPRITGSLQDLSGLLSVTALNVANCPGVTGVLSALAELSNLLELDVTGCPEVHGDVSALWRAVPSCVVRHEERHVPHHVDDKDDVLGAVLEEDLEELDALEHFGTGGDDAAALIFTEERDNRLAETLRATQPRMMVVTAAADTNAAEPAAELSREASPVGWGRG
jgi:hypothetical protein